MKMNHEFCKSIFSIFLLGVVTFTGLGVSIVFLRQKISSHALHIRSLEHEFQEIDIKTLSLANHIAQLETPLYLQFQSRRNFKFPSAHQVIRIRNWPYASRMTSSEKEYATSIAMVTAFPNERTL
jgi:hypothetical protein